MPLEYCIHSTLQVQGDVNTHAMIVFILDQGSPRGVCRE